MIAIINQAKRNHKGETLYHLKINHELICEFWHKWEDGLAECLLKASKEVFIQEAHKKFRFLESENK